MNRLFEESFLQPRYLEPFRHLVPIDLRETPSEYVIEASIPGIKPEEMEITATDNVLMIRATRKQEEKTEKTRQYVRRERYEGEMSRSIRLPGPIDASKVNATYEHGVLTVTVPKTGKSGPAQIPVQIKESGEAKKLGGQSGTSTTHS
jgi:HSP20 family protein